jgi:hypothetical protein
MANEKSYAAKGTKLQMGDGASPEVFTDIGNLGDVDGPGSKLDTVEVTHHGSDAKEYAATIIDGGEVKWTINYDPAGATHNNSAGGILYVMQQKTLKNFKLVFPAAVAAGPTFAAFVTDFQPKAPVAGKLSADITLKISGPVTWP